MLSLTSVVLTFNVVGEANPATKVAPTPIVGAILAVIFIAIIVWAIINSKKETAEMKEVVNTKIKFREPFRPFAPVVTEDRAAEYFSTPNLDKQYPPRYMLMV